MSVYGVGALGGRPLWGFIIARIGIHRTLVLFGVSYGSAIVTFLVPSEAFGIYAATLLLGLAIAGLQQMQAQVFPDYYGRAIVGALTGYSGLTYTIARAAAPLYAAVAYDASQSYMLAFGSFAVACFISAAAFLLAAPPKHRDPVGQTVSQRAQSYPPT